MPQQYPGTRTRRGFTLVERAIVIAVAGLALAGVVAVYGQAVRGSRSDPLARKQAIAVVESLLTEVLMQPFTWCDPQDAANDAAAPPRSAASCTGGAKGSQDKGGGMLGPQPRSETRTSPSDPFDNVADYDGYAMGPGIVDRAGVAVPGLEGYSAHVSVTRAGAVFGLSDDAVLRVDVLVSGRGESVTLTGYRFRHSPTAGG